MWILGVRYKMVYMINYPLSAPLLIWWKDESSSNSILPIQRKWTAFYMHAILSYSWVSDAIQNAVLLPTDVCDCLEKSNFSHTTFPTASLTVLQTFMFLLCWIHIQSKCCSNTQRVHHEVWYSRTKFPIPFLSYFPTGKIVLSLSSSRVLQRN